MGSTCGADGRDHRAARPVRGGKDRHDQTHRRVHATLGGVVKIEGKDLAAISEAELYELRRGMSVVLQGTLPFTCGLYLLAERLRERRLALRARTRWPPEHIDQVTLAHLDMVGLRDRANDMPEQLSAGMCKRTALARALALEARIVIIDDFDSGSTAFAWRCSAS